MKTSIIAAIALFILPIAGARADADKKTERLWKAKCATCHGADGKGVTEEGAKMGISDYTAAAWQTGHTDAQLKEAITKGITRTKGGKTQAMDPFGDKLDAAQIDALVAYIRTLK